MLSSISFTFHFVIKCHYIQSINCFNFNLIIINRQDVTILYYYIIYSFYQDAEKGQLERETCDMRVGNYRCDEIKDGTVIIKHNGENATKDENVNEDLLDAEEL